ncbi:MAG: leucyl/phenylalanyl-tRNA--protein transferase [Pseudomonadota bacterium]
MIPSDVLSLTAQHLLQAYASGIFPMAESRDEPGVFWVDPRHRGVLPLDGFHISRSLSRRMRRGEYTLSLNHEFSGVLDACAAREETWINEEIRTLYISLHEIGHAHSFEVWQQGELAGGVYGVTLGGAFFGESMFSARTDGSKLALAHLVAHLRKCGFVLFDTQFLTPHLASLGAIEIPRAEYRARLSDALGQKADITARPVAVHKEGSGYSHPAMQRNTQTS